MKFPKARTAKPATWSLVSNIDESRTAPLRKALLVGSAIFASNNDVKPKDYVRIAARQGAGFLQSLLTKQVPRIYVAVNEAVMRAAPRGTRFALAIDAYLQWGLRSKGKTILIGGHESLQETYLDVLVFEGGRVALYENKVLPSVHAPHFKDTMTALMDEYASAHPGCKFVLAAPLTNTIAAFPSIQNIGDKIFRRLSFRPLTLQAAARHNNLAVPAGIVGLGVLFYAGMMGKAWTDYSTAKHAFEVEIGDPIVKGQGGIDSGIIDTIQQRRFFLDEPRRQVALSEKSKALVSGIGRIEGLKIVELKLPAPSVGLPTSSIGVPVLGQQAEAGETKPDVWLRVSVPLQGAAAMLQGRAVMQAISANTGMSVRLARQGWTEEGKRRVFTIEGFIHG